MLAIIKRNRGEIALFCLTLALWLPGRAGDRLKRHSMFEVVPRGFRYHHTSGIMGADGVWLPAPLYWLLAGWRQVKLSYLRWSLRRKFGKLPGRPVIVCLKCGTHNETWKCSNCGNSL